MTTFTASQKLPKIATGPEGGPMPWVDPWKFIQATNAGMAGKMLHQALESSRGSTGLGGKI